MSTTVVHLNEGGYFLGDKVRGRGIRPFLFEGGVHLISIAHRHNDLDKPVGWVALANLLEKLYYIIIIP